MKFLDEEHKQFVERCVEKAKNNDCYHLSLFYVLGLTENCRRNIDSLYGWSDGCVKIPEGDAYGWITGTDIRIIRLAYNLYNNGAPTAFGIEDLEEKNRELMEYLPTSILGYLSSELIEYCFEGIRVRYEMVTMWLLRFWKNAFCLVIIMLNKKHFSFLNYRNEKMSTKFNACLFVLKVYCKK